MLNGLFNIGQSALNASQAWISVTGNNLANADTEGYSRQYVDQKDAGGLTYRPGAQPLGVNAQQIMRFFDQFLESSYVSQSSNSTRWDARDTVMSTVENLFNESNRGGVSSALTNFFNAWQELSLRPEDSSVRQNLVSMADNLKDMFGNTADTLLEIQKQMDVNIAQGVARVNEIAKAIADLNGQITSGTIDGMSNPNALLDKRDQLVRELATYVDVEAIDHGKGNFRVQLKTGQPLADGVNVYSLEIRGPMNENRLISGSSYAGKVNVQGTDDFEYALEITDPGYPGDPAATPPEPARAAKFKVSLDNGKTWLQNPDGSLMERSIEPTDPNNPGGESKPMRIKELLIQFTESQGFTLGDKFDIVPKSGLYWNEPTKGPQNVTPQINNGQDNPDRVSGGKLAAYYNVRDDNIGRYMDQLDAAARALIWEVNRLHSQGAGLTMHTSTLGEQRVEDKAAALGTPQAALAFADGLQKGNVNFQFYDKNVTAGDNSVAYVSLNFSADPNQEENFDPARHSLQDVVDAINRIEIEADGAAVNPLKASVQDGRLVLESKEPFEFALGPDTAGLMAALGVNSFFSGSGAGSIGVASAVHNDVNFIAAGAVNGQHEVNKGDNSTATAISKLIDKTVAIATFWKTEKNQTIGEYYANLVATVGGDRRLCKTNSEYHAALAADLSERVESVRGVNMDEEMSNLIKHQHSYTAAAKLITTADQMLQTLLGIKQ